ncbi:choice-of-anchor D domain-containing protein [Tenacibaculum sp. IB213877]|uniref:choice-of-anchor D domain-containing protein n=1 Tax=Tenacibaculum sp. IB213877 TaxID=3097351 RepID=UPI002A5A8D07|nr:choice-of-anchor D domain-containing protein [Tenacibaculum sp. IB213877]MDY0781136.1 choice-of-anchor D domain-containing protein [Tenacibaculum sp. IB213877]
MRKKIIKYASLFLIFLAVFTGCDKDEKILPAEFSIDETMFDFGNVMVTGSSSKTFTITNTGGRDLELSSFSLNGSSSVDFSLNASETSLSAGESYAFEVSFEPQSEGAKSVNLVIITNNGEETINIAGTATPELIAGATLSATALDFTDVQIGQTNDLSFTITSSGNTDLEITGFSFSGTDAADFSTNATPTTLVSNNAMTVEITFAPQTEGNKSATLEIVTNAGVVSLSVLGNAIPEPIAVISLDNTSLDFGDVTQGEDKDLTLVVSNTGNADLVINDFVFNGTDASDFSVQNITTPVTVDSGTDLSVTIRFTPSSEGEKSSVLVIDSNVADASISLIGKAIAPAAPIMVFSESPIAFGNVEVGQELSKNITISNTGNADLDITNVNIVGGSTASSFSVVGGTSSLIRTIAAGDTYTFEVKFTPSSEGFASGSIRLINNSNDNDVFLGMNGTGTAPAQPAIAFSETGLNFGDVTVGNSGTDLTFDIQNNGQGNLEVSNIRISGANASDFSLINVSAPQTIVSNSSYTVTVRFTPQSEGQKYATIVVESNDPTKPNYALIVQGNGLQAVTGNVVNIPDANFKTALVGDSSINTNGDGEIQVSEAQAYTGVIRVDGLSISDVTGLEVFENISQFHAMNNALTSIDLSQNTAITHLSLKNNNLTSLDLSANTALQTILIQQNGISTIDLTNHSSLVNFQCGGNNISTLVLPTVANGLRTLYLEQNQISSLDVSMYPDLRTLVVYNNNLTSIDISANSKVKTLHVRNNNLSNLNVANGNNVNFLYMVADGNANLTCIQHDAGFDPLNPPNTAANQWVKPTGASWSTTACP